MLYYKKGNNDEQTNIMINKIKNEFEKLIVIKLVTIRFKVSILIKF